MAEDLEKPTETLQEQEVESKEEEVNVLETAVQSLAEDLEKPTETLQEEEVESKEEKINVNVKAVYHTGLI